ncbi:MAG: hypothetical protein ACP5IO_04970 [Elusimicrobiales bacterium]
MRIQVKKIDISSVIFSGFSVTLFFVSLFIAIVAIFITPSPLWIGESFRTKFIGAFFYTMTVYIITLAYISFLVFIYNFLVSVIGIRGIKLDIEEETE